MRVPVWLTCMLMALSFLWGRMSVRPATVEPVAVIRAEEKARPLEPEKLERRPVPVPSKVTDYTEPTVVRDTMILIPTGLKEWAILPTRHSFPNISISHRSVEVPVYRGGLGSVYRYDIPQPPDRIRLDASVGLMFSKRLTGPKLTLSASTSRVGVEAALTYDVISRGLTPVLSTTFNLW
jgi:hypothetical protein